MEFHVKLKKVKKTLVLWGRRTCGDIFKKVATLEEQVKMKEIQLELDPSIENRAELNRCAAELRRFYTCEEEFGKQKAGIRWFGDGDRNTKFFHSYVNGRRRRLTITEIQTAQGDIISFEENIEAEAVAFYEEQFREDIFHRDLSMLDCISSLVTEEQNARLTMLPTMEEVQQVIFAMNGDSASGPNGMSGIFYQCCWDIVKEDVYRVVKSFFCGFSLPKFITQLIWCYFQKRRL